jgi:hypothetical protein
VGNLIGSRGPASKPCAPNPTIDPEGNDSEERPRRGNPPLRADDLPDLKAVIDANELFPSAMLDNMAAAFLADGARGSAG